MQNKTKNLDWELKTSWVSFLQPISYVIGQNPSYFGVLFSSQLRVQNFFPVLTIYHSATQEISVLLGLYFHRNQ